MTGGSLDFLSSPPRRRVTAGGRSYYLRMPSAAELLRVRATARAAAKSPEELTMLTNAALIAAAAQTESGGQAFSDGAQVLEELTPAALSALAEAYGEAARQDDPPLGVSESRREEIRAALKSDPVERLKWRVLRSFGALPTEPRALAMREGDYLYCVLSELIDREEELDAFCPSCRAEAQRQCCPVCGRETWGGNPSFDMERFLSLSKKERGGDA